MLSAKPQSVLLIMLQKLICQQVVTGFAQYFRGNLLQINMSVKICSSESQCCSWWYLLQRRRINKRKVPALILTKWFKTKRKLWCIAVSDHYYHLRQETVVKCWQQCKICTMSIKVSKYTRQVDNYGLIQWKMYINLLHNLKFPYIHYFCQGEA